MQTANKIKQASGETNIHIETLKQRAALLEERISRIKHDLTAVHSTDLDDQALERENDEVLDQLGNNSQQELRLIRRALQRYEQGEYGICQRCRLPIDSARLGPVPEAEFCIDCQS